LEDALNEKGVEKEPDIHDWLEDLGAWARANLSGSIVLHNRAIRAATKFPFEEVPLVYNTRLALKRKYVPMRRNGDAETRVAFEETMRQLALENTASFAGPGAGEQGDEYFVDYGRQRRALDYHAKGSNSRDERYGSRIYYSWDDDSKQMIIGWLPSHLRTRAS
jgi:hypothetical protein